VACRYTISDEKAVVVFRVRERRADDVIFFWNGAAMTYAVIGGGSGQFAGTKTRRWCRDGELKARTTEYGGQ
jgi:hypothetical protein